MPSSFGTNHFVNLDAASRYYEAYGEGGPTSIKQMIAEGRIAIGPPPCKPDERAILNREEGRYFREIVDVAQLAHQPAAAAAPSMKKEGARMKISNEILAVLSTATTDGPRLFLHGELDRKLYQEVNKVLEANGGKWNRSARAHVFSEPAAEAIEQVLLTGEFQNIKQDLGQFDTPDLVAGRVAELAEVRENMTVLEPSAGIGNLVAAILKRLPEPARIIIRANEIDEKRCRQLSERFDIVSGVRCGRVDFMKVDPAAVSPYDRVLMNPPFAKQADIAHVMHASRFVKPGGRLVSIMSASVTFRSDARTKAFREFVDANEGVIERLPEGAFKESGTAVNAVIVSVNL
ncbi:Type I restriction-modification system methyltransferase subunit family protein (modular protein) [Mesorhizobium plurifarium]|uniref:Type I restriction-modification system methyltransferase subunit family protein (Modular protein) n=1 Tax=Mesorhizobium plurifarium TaxID=69974 RepID=A0A090G775_MESPL|nr:Type I restriction-modification system methyltransferase subunit family protein (modular protein) [Mesorhizobium plurifarium]